MAVRDINKLLDDTDELIPKWLNFVKDVVDSEDLPLNVYRETLLQKKILRVIKKNHVSKYLEILAEIAEKKNDDYKKLYEQFDKRLKLGIHKSNIDGVGIPEWLRFNTSKPRVEQISFKEYVHRMEEGAERHLLHHRREYLCCILFVVRRKICARRAMRYYTRLTLWMNMPCASPVSLTEGS